MQLLPLYLSGLAGASTCNWDFELLLLQDASTSYSSLISEMIGSVSELVEGAKEHFAEVRFGLSAFIDKPAPFRGVGNGRGHANGLDYCYKRVSPFTTDHEQLINSYYDLQESGGSGGDSPENPYEAMMYAALDPEMGYKEGSQDEEGRDRVRAMLIVTDDVPHYEGDLATGISMWNGNSHDDKPHFGDPEFIDSPSYYENDFPAIYGGREVSGSAYSKFLTLSQGDEEYDELLQLVGPASYAEPSNYGNATDNIKFVDDTSSATSRCATYEYPSLSIVGQAIVSRNLIPVFVVTVPPVVSTESEIVCRKRGFVVDEHASTNRRNAQFLKCLVGLYEEDLRAMKIPHAMVITYDGSTSSFVDTVLEGLEDLSGKMGCKSIPGTNAWIAGIAAGAGLVVCLGPAFLPKGDLTPSEVPSDLPTQETSESSASMDGSDSCSWTNYI